MRVGNREITVRGRLLRIARLDAEKYQFIDDPEPLIAAMRKREVDLFTFLQRLPDTKPRLGYPVEWDNLAVLPVSTFDQWWTHQIDNKTRNMVRKAEKKGLRIEEVPFDDTLVAGIWSIYNECPVRQGKPFAHFGKAKEQVRLEESTYLDASIFIGAFFDSVLVGFIKLVIDERRTQAGLLNIVAMVQHRDKAPMNGLVAEAVRACARRGIPYLVYSNFAYGKKKKDSLSDFKANNGFKQVDIPRYYVPLTFRGRCALRLRLHHGPSDLIPEAVMARLRSIRSAWYGRKLQSAAQKLL
jgi:hypothetical protein